MYLLLTSFVWCCSLILTRTPAQGKFLFTLVHLMRRRGSSPGKASPGSIPACSPLLYIIPFVSSLINNNFKKVFQISYHILKHTVVLGISLVVKWAPSLVFILLSNPDIAITKWHMPFVRQQLVCAMEETFWKKGGVKFANINLVSNWTAKFQLNELPFKCSRPWLHTFNPEVNLIWSQRAVQRHNPLIDKANWGEMRVKVQKRQSSQWRRC